MTNKHKQLIIVAGISALVSAAMVYASYNTTMIFNKVGLGSNKELLKNLKDKGWF